MGRPKKSLRETVEKEMPEFAGEVAGLSAEELNNRLATLAKNLDELEQTKEKDEDLENAQANAAALLAPYRDGKKYLKLKTRYIIGLIREKGGQ